MPSHFGLGALRDGRLRVRVPIAVHVTWHDPYLMLHAPAFDEWGYGRTLSEALVDLQRAIAELYLTLEHEQDHLGPDLARIWRTLQETIHRRP